MRRVRCRLLGPFELTVPGARSPVALESRKARELLGMLLVRPTGSVTREWAATALWPDLDHDHVRKQLRQALWHIHDVADTCDEDRDRLVLADADHLAINEGLAPWCDASEFAASASTCLDDEDASGQRLETSIDLYRGPLLDGCFSEWCLVERERLDALYLSLLDLATVRAEWRHDHAAAMRWAWQLLALDPAHERSHRRLMRLYHEAGDRTRALRQFQRCERALQDELGVSPSTRTTRLASAIREDDEVPAALRPDRRRQPGLPVVDGADRPDDDESRVLRELASLRRAVDGLREVVMGKMY